MLLKPQQHLVKLASTVNNQDGDHCHQSLCQLQTCKKKNNNPVNYYYSISTIVSVFCTLSTSFDRELE